MYPPEQQELFLKVQFPVQEEETLLQEREGNNSSTG
jgi:hypothetical protein